MPAVNVDGASLDYIEQGSGQPLIFVHGSINDHRTWGQQIDAFAERYRVIAYTRRHYHGSEDAAPKRPPSVTTAADDVIAVIERLGLAPAHLGGSSYGAFTALLAAAKRPELVRTLVLGEPPAGYLLVSDPAAKPVWDQFVSAAFEPAQANIRAGDLENGLRTFVDGVIGSGAFDMLPPPARALMLDNASTLAIEAEPLEVFAEAQAARVTMPVLLVTGEHSPPMFGQITDRLHRLLPHAERIEIRGASHVMHAENAPAYNVAVLEFLSRHT
jgi:pimeloyl-ACP methyl ester carboxylesterase